MSFLPRIVHASFAAMLFLGFCSLAVAQNSLMKPPPNCVVKKIGGVRFVNGEVFLAEHADTAVLISHGFRDLVYIGRSVGSVKYSATWPLRTDLSSLPQHVSGVNYETWQSAEQTEEPLFDPDLDLTPAPDDYSELRNEQASSRDDVLSATRKSVSQEMANRRKNERRILDRGNLTMRPRPLRKVWVDEWEDSERQATYSRQRVKRYVCEPNSYNDTNSDPGTYYFMPGQQGFYGESPSVTSGGCSGIGSNCGQSRGNLRGNTRSPFLVPENRDWLFFPGSRAVSDSSRSRR